MPDDPWPDVPGYVVLPGETSPDDAVSVAAVEQGTRRRVVLRRLPALREGERSRVAEALARYADVDGDDLAAPAELAEGADVLVLAGAGRTLEDAAAAPRTSGQLVTALVPVAAALGELHAAGLAYGSISERCVQVDDDGRPRLVDAGHDAALHVLAPREMPEPTVTGDMDGLRALALRLAEAVPDPGLAEAFADPGATSSAQAAADTVLDLAPPEPLPGWVEGDRGVPLGPAPGSGGEPGRDVGVWAAARDRLGQRPWLLAGALVLVAAMVATTAVLVTRDGSGEPTAAREARPEPVDPSEATPLGTGAATAEPTPDAEPTADGPSATTDVDAEVAAAAGIALCGAPPPAPESAPEVPDDWAEVVDGLYVARSAALVTGQTSLLCEVYDPLSPGLAADIALDAAYREQDVRPDRLDFVVEAVTEVESDAGVVLLEVTDRLEPYQLVTSAGRVVAELPGVASETWQARVVPDASGTEWRFG